jgi:head-tail adaptor
MIQDYFYSITVKRREKTPDGLGGATTTYKTLGTVQGLLERSSSTERLIAATRT